MNDERPPEPGSDEQVEDLDVPESEREEVKGGRQVYEWWKKVEGDSGFSGG